MEVETDGDDFGTGTTAGICTLREAVEAARTDGRTVISGRGIAPVPGFSSEIADNQAGATGFAFGGALALAGPTNTGEDTVCAGPGDDAWAPGAGASADDASGGPGRDFVNCGAGDNSEEKAVVDPEDPPPISC
jgi:hypothetical protein